MSYNGFTLKQETDNYTVRLRFVQTYDPDRSTGVVPLPIVGEGAESSLLLAFTGEEKRITVNAFLYDDGVDISDGTAPGDEFPSGVVSVNDQIKYWEYYIKKPNIGTKWTLTGPSIPSEGTEVFLSRVNIPLEAATPNEGTLNIELVVGSVV